MDSGSFDDQPPGAQQGTSSQCFQTVAFNCPGCSYSFMSQFFLHRHLKRIHGDIYWRMVQNGQIDSAACASSAARPQITGSVTDQIHGDAERPRSCSHQQTSSEKKTHVCPLCDKAFSRLNNLTIHLRIHAGEKPFRCSQCEQRFSALGHLKAHKHSHAATGGRDENERRRLFEPLSACSRTPRPTSRPESSHAVFSCVECPYAFSSAVYLYRHLKCSHSEVYWQMVRSGEIDAAAGCQQTTRRTANGQMHGYPTDQAPGSYRLAHHQHFTDTLTRPVRPPRRKPYMCVACDVCFSNVFDLKDHRRDQHM